MPEDKGVRADPHLLQDEPDDPLAIGGELHADEEATLLELGSRQRHLWAINLYPDGDERVEFKSMINVRPGQGNVLMLLRPHQAERPTRVLDRPPTQHPADLVERLLRAESCLRNRVR